MKQLLNRLLFFAYLLLIFFTQTAQSQNHHEDELLVKAAFVYNFAKFTRWPENVWLKKNNSFNICTMGEDNLISKLQSLRGKNIKGHSVSVAQLTNRHALEICHLLYIAKSEKENYQENLKAAQNKPILTVSEIPEFARSGGAIELYRGKNQTHFIINLNTTKKSELEISSRLLDLAVVITEEE